MKAFHGTPDSKNSLPHQIQLLYFALAELCFADFSDLLVQLVQVDHLDVKFLLELIVLLKVFESVQKVFLNQLVLDDHYLILNDLQQFPFVLDIITQVTDSSLVELL